MGRPDTEYDVVVVHPREAADPWAAVNAFRERRAASGRVFADSTALIREDRDR